MYPHYHQLIIFLCLVLFCLIDIDVEVLNPRAPYFYYKVKPLALWYGIEWTVAWDKIERHEQVVRQMALKVTQYFPNQQYRYFNKRFSGTGKRVWLFLDLDDVTFYEHFLKTLRQDAEWNALVEDWHSCIGNSNQPFYWQEIQLK